MSLLLLSLILMHAFKRSVHQFCLLVTIYSLCLQKRASKQHSLQFTSYADHEVEDKASAPYEIQTSIRARDIEDRVFDELAFDERAFDELELAARNPDLQDNERRFIGLILAGVRAGIQAGIRAGVRGKPLLSS